MESGVARRLAASGAAKIFYVSCDPATMTRDLKELCRNYRIASVRWFNMFPRTARFETLAVLDRIAPGEGRS
jgi:23S rRNA (uracil1939-C5)-methyltransferase